MLVKMQCILLALLGLVILAKAVQERGRDVEGAIQINGKAVDRSLMDNVQEPHKRRKRSETPGGGTKGSTRRRRTHRHPPRRDEGRDYPHVPEDGGHPRPENTPPSDDGHVTAISSYYRWTTRPYIHVPDSGRVTPGRRVTQGISKNATTANSWSDGGSGNDYSTTTVTADFDIDVASQKGKQMPVDIIVVMATIGVFLGIFFTIAGFLLFRWQKYKPGGLKEKTMSEKPTLPPPDFGYTSHIQETKPSAPYLPPTFSNTKHTYQDINISNGKLPRKETAPAKQLAPPPLYPGHSPQRTTPIQAKKGVPSSKLQRQTKPTRGNESNGNAKLSSASQQSNTSYQPLGSRISDHSYMDIDQSRSSQSGKGYIGMNKREGNSLVNELTMKIASIKNGTGPSGPSQSGPTAKAPSVLSYSSQGQGDGSDTLYPPPSIINSSISYIDMNINNISGNMLPMDMVHTHTSMKPVERPKEQQSATDKTVVPSTSWQSHHQSQGVTRETAQSLRSSSGYEPRADSYDHVYTPMTK